VDDVRLREWGLRTEGTENGVVRKGCGRMTSCLVII